MNNNQLNNMVQGVNLYPQINSGVWGFSGNNGFFILENIIELESKVEQTELLDISGRMFPNQYVAYQAISQDYIRKYFSCNTFAKPYVPTYDEFAKCNEYIANRKFVKAIVRSNNCRCYNVFSYYGYIIAGNIKNIIRVIVENNLLDATIVEYDNFDKAKSDIIVDVACKKFQTDNKPIAIPSNMDIDKIYRI